MTADVDDWLDAGARPETTVELVLAGKLLDAYAVKATELAALLGDSNRSMADGGKIRDLRDGLEDLREQMAKATRVVTLRAHEPDAYYRLVIEHPPRDGNQLDAVHRVNFDTFIPILVRASIVDPVLTDEQYDKLRAKLSPQQWSELWQAAVALNRDEVALPKSLPAFGQTESSGGGQSKPAPSASASNGSTAGSQPRRPAKKRKG